MREFAVLVPNSDRVAAEVLDGDAVIIHVVTGTYYSTQGIGGWVWERCAAGQSLHEIRSLGTGRYDVSAEQLTADLEAFAAALQEEDLVSEKPAPEPPGVVGPVPAGSVQDDGPVERMEYKPPTLTIYRDLKDLLALDPPMPRLDLETPSGR